MLVTASTLDFIMFIYLNYINIAGTKLITTCAIVGQIILSSLVYKNTKYICMTNVVIK